MRRIPWLRTVLALGVLAFTALQVGAAHKPLSPAAKALVTRAFQDIDPSLPLVDVHAHLVGTPQGGHGCEVHPSRLSTWHPLKRIATDFYLRAGGGTDLATFDDVFVKRLVDLAKGFPRPVRFHLLAMDHTYGPDGTLDRARTEFHVPNARVVEVARQYPDVFVPVISVHPYRADALVELNRWADQGVRWVKWLPNAQGMDPADPRCLPFYHCLVARGMVLLTHAGEEQAVAAHGGQELGNPLKLRVPLDAGVTVVVAHCASLGKGTDLDHPGQKVPNFELFLRLMGEERYRGRLYGDLSAITQVNRGVGPMLGLLERPELQGRLVNGSDHPLPGMNFVVWTSQLARKGLITREERKALNELHRANPLLFDMVLKRVLRHPKTGRQLAPETFTLQIKAR